MPMWHCITLLPICAGRQRRCHPPSRHPRPLTSYLGTLALTLARYAPHCHIRSTPFPSSWGSHGTRGPYTCQYPHRNISAFHGLRRVHVPVPWASCDSAQRPPHRCSHRPRSEILTVHGAQHPKIFQIITELLARGTVGRAHANLSPRRWASSLPHRLKTYATCH